MLSRRIRSVLLASLVPLLCGAAGSEAVANVPRPIKNVIPEIEGKPGRNGLIVFVLHNRNRGSYFQGPSGIYTYNPRTKKQSLLLKSKKASQPRFTADGDSIVFVDVVDGARGIYSMNPNGTDRVEITTDIHYLYRPALIPRDRIWFVNDDREVSTIKVDGSGLRNLGKLRGEPTYGSAIASGGKVVYQSESGHPNVDIFIYNRKTGKNTRLTDGPKWEWEPRISPDGRWVTYTNDGGDATWIMHANGKGKRRVAYSTGDIGLGEPMFAPDSVSMMVKVYYARVATYLSTFSLKHLSRHGQFTDISRNGSVDIEDADWQTR
ncbi:MAG: PD40 domain-containing protein [Solirubrobacterales bacterium]|nr:PD40 domain-containing protein [Solirubrobacterales bacterium]